MEKRYVMERRGDTAVVTVEEPLAFQREPDWRYLEHLGRHSPDGFEWGYGGSGPADLARSIVGDHLGTKSPHPRLYQEVKRRLVASLPYEGGAITRAQVEEVVQDFREAGHPLQEGEPVQERSPAPPHPLEGQQVLAVRPVLPEELQQLGWSGPADAFACLEFEGGAVLYLGTDPIGPGALFSVLGGKPQRLQLPGAEVGA